MKSMKSVCVCVLVLSGVLLAAKGEQLRTDINPALLYYQAFLLTPKLSDADWDYLVTNNWQGQKLPERFGSVVSNYDTELQLLRQAAQQKVSCDWGIDMSPGAETLLPHLASAKRAAMGARFHAMWDLQNGNEAAARDDLIAGLTLGRNVSQNKTLISVLVEIAIENIVNDTVAENFHRFSPETLQQLADGFASAPAWGSVASCASTEKLIHNGALARIEELQKQYRENNAVAIEALRKLLRGTAAVDAKDEYWNQLTNAAGGTIDGIIKLIRDSEPFTAKAFKIMALPYKEYDEQMQQFSAEVQKSVNPIVSQELPAWAACRRREFMSLEDTAMVHAAIEYKLHGEAGLKSVMDPCGNGSFSFQRFVFDGVDRGFELKSAFNRGKVLEAFIFIENDGTPFNIMGDRVGQPFSR